MNKQHYNLYTTRDLDGCLCAVFANMLAAHTMTGITVTWINPGNPAPVQRLISDLQVAEIYEAPLPQRRDVIVCGATPTEEMLSQLQDLSSPEHHIRVFHRVPTERCPTVCSLWADYFAGTPLSGNLPALYIAYSMLIHDSEETRLASLLATLGPQNFVSVVADYCRNHPRERFTLAKFKSIEDFVTYAGHE